jgi:hypothetical protein
MRIDTMLRRIAVLVVLAASCSGVWAASISCAYTGSGSGIGGTGIDGSGIGGTGAVAKGSGIGGTGIKPEYGRDGMQLAGDIIFSQGDVKALSKGRSRLLAKGDPVCVGETIVTSQSGSAQIRMADGGFVAIHPQTELKIEKYVYRGTKKDESLLALLKGACRIITGKIGKRYPQNDLVKTPTVIIGIRGTDHEPTVVLPGDKGDYPAGTYDRVNEGTTFIKTEKGEIEIHPNQVGFAASAGELPTILKDVPAFYVARPFAEKGEIFPKAASKKEDAETKPSYNPNGVRSEVLESQDQSRSPEDSDRPISAESGGDRPESPEVHERGETPGPETTEIRELPESPEIPELPESPEIPELPESPEIPELPESPEIPELPE